MSVNGDFIRAARDKVNELTVTDWNNRAVPIYPPDVDVVNDPDAPGYPHIKANVFTARPDKRVVEAGAGCVEHTWLLQLSVVLDNSHGMIKALDMVDQVVNHFPAYTTFGTDDRYKVIEAPNTIPRIVTDASVTYPVQMTVLYIS